MIAKAIQSLNSLGVHTHTHRETQSMGRRTVLHSVRTAAMIILYAPVASFSGTWYVQYKRYARVCRGGGGLTLWNN